MRSPILTAAARVLTPMILVASVFLLYRGHNLPGGGFIGGLTAGGALLLHAFGCGARESRALLARPQRLMAWGLVLAGLSAAPGLLLKATVFAGVWLPAFNLPVLGVVHLGTPLLFDIGVFLVVIGFVVDVARSLDEDFSNGTSIGSASGKDASWN
jgi:multicomponent Na+:H+ antiporter subunit B